MKGCRYRDASSPAWPAKPHSKGTGSNDRPRAACRHSLRLPRRLDPFGLLFTRLAGKGDIRHRAATSALPMFFGREASSCPLTPIFDGGKGRQHCSWQPTADPLLTGAAGLVAVVGHCFPVWLKFQGGRLHMRRHFRRIRSASWSCLRSALAWQRGDHALLVAVGPAGNARMQRWAYLDLPAPVIVAVGDERAQLGAAPCQHRPPAQRHGKSYRTKIGLSDRLQALIVYSDYCLIPAVWTAKNRLPAADTDLGQSMTFSLLLQRYSRRWKRRVPDLARRAADH